MIARLAGEMTAAPRPWRARAPSSIPCEGGNGADEGCEREQRAAAEEHALVAQKVGRATAEEQESGEGEGVGVDDPLEVALAEAEPALIEGKATLTIETSRMTMNCARQTRIKSPVRLSCLSAIIGVALVRRSS